MLVYPQAFLARAKDVQVTRKFIRLGFKEVVPMQDSSKRLGYQLGEDWLRAGAVLS